jgi:hypothetical protein
VNRVRKVPIIILLFLLSIGVSAIRSQTALSAEQILKKAEKRMLDAKTFQVSGVVAVVKNLKPYEKLSWGQALSLESIELTRELSFSFFYDRPDKLRFDWQNFAAGHKRASSIWSDGKKVFVWTPRTLETDGSFLLDTALDRKSALQEAEFGKSFGIATILLTQLTGDDRSFAFGGMKEASIVREEKVSDSSCYVILGVINNDPWVIWVTRPDFRIKKARFQVSLTSFDEIVETGRQKLTIGEINFIDPKFDEKILDAVFSYKPILGKKDIDLAKYDK